MADDYCELCDLPRSQCIHGMPPPAAPLKKPAPRRKPARKAAPVATTRPRPRKWTTPEAIRPHILHVLREAGGALEADEAFKHLEERMADSLLSADQELTPEGELRWRYAARRARQALIADGLMAKARPGLWSLTAAGLADH
jgi:hypothetical protein